MKVLAVDEARRWCKGFNTLRVTKEDLLHYQGRQRFEFTIRTPTEFRRMALLCHDLLSFTGGHEFEGGLLWLQGWHLGVNRIIKVGWQTLEDLRRAQGCVQPLEVAPAQVFRSDEFVGLHAFLLYTMAYEWGGHLLPRNGGFFLDIRMTGRLSCVAESSAIQQKLMEHLTAWNPSKGRDQLRR